MIRVGLQVGHRSPTVASAPRNRANAVGSSSSSIASRNAASFHGASPCGSGKRRPARASSAMWPRISPTAAILCASPMPGCSDRRSQSGAPAMACVVPNSSRSATQATARATASAGSAPRRTSRAVSRTRRCWSPSSSALATPRSAACRRSCRVGRRDVQPDATGLEANRVARQLVAADQGRAGCQVEFPVVPVAGQHAAIGQRSLAQRIAFMRTAIGAGEHAALGVQQQDLPAFMAHDCLALRREFIEWQRVDPGHAVPPIWGWERGDAIGAAPRPGEDVIGSLDRDSGAQHGAEHLEFGAAEALAGGRRGADRAVVLQQQEPVGVGSPLGHVAFARADFRQAAPAFRPAWRHRPGRRGRRAGSLAPAHTDQSIEGRLAQFGPHRVDQPQGQFGMGVGEPCVAGFGQMPEAGSDGQCRAARFPLPAIPSAASLTTCWRAASAVMPSSRGNIGDPLRPAPLDHAKQAVCRRGGGDAESIIQVHAWIMPCLATRRKSDTCTNWRSGLARDLMSDRMVAQQAGRRGDGGNRADLRLHRHRRRLGRLRGGIAPVRIRPPSRAAAGSRAAGSQSVDPHPARLRQDLCRSRGELEVRDRTAAAAWQPPPVSAARQDARRLQLDQRHGLYPRQPRRLRRMAPARLRRLGLGFGPAVLQEGAEPDPRRGRLPRRRRPAARLRPAGPLRTRRCGAGGLRAGRHPAQSRLQRRAAGRLRLLPDHHAEPPPLERRAGLSAAGAQARQSGDPHRRACDARADREQPRGRRRIPYRRKAARPPARAARSLCRAVPMARRSFCCCRALVPRSICRTWASQWSATCRPSAPTCTTTSTPMWPGAAARRSR